MMKHKLPLQVAGSIFLVLAVGHLARLLLKVPVMVAGAIIPLWVSVIGFAVALGLSFWMFRSAR